jgi:predicted RecA/RadA family phage recombinase
MRNYVQEGATVTAAAPYALTAGQAALVGAALFGVASNDAGNGATVELLTEGVFDITALTTDTCSVGAVLYWDNSNRRLTTTATGNLYVGVALAAKGNGDTTARIRLNGKVPAATGAT